MIDPTTHRIKSERYYHGDTSRTPSPGLYPDPNHGCGGVGVGVGGEEVALFIFKTYL